MRRSVTIKTRRHLGLTYVLLMGAAGICSILLWEFIFDISHFSDGGLRLLAGGAACGLTGGATGYMLLLPKSAGDYIYTNLLSIVLGHLFCMVGLLIMTYFADPAFVGQDKLTALVSFLILVFGLQVFTLFPIALFFANGFWWVWRLWRKFRFRR